MSLSEERLIAYADGELSAAEKAEVEAALAADPALAERAERHRQLRAKITRTYAPVLAEPVPERLMQAVRGAAPVVVDLASRRQAKTTLPLATLTAAAASLVVGLVAGAGLTRLQPPPMVSSGHGGLEARGALATALDSQLAVQPAPGVIKIGLSFRGADRRYCRTFQASGGGGLAGVACRNPEGWQVELAMAQAAPAQAEDYRTAGSSMPPPVLAKVQGMIVGAPLDAQGESDARAKGWRP